MAVNIFCCARVNAPNVSADEWRKFRRFINGSLKVQIVPEVPKVPKVPKVTSIEFKFLATSETLNF
jgi:hypothetical protein